MGDGAGTHRAGLQRHVEIAVREPLRAERSRGGAHGQHLGMGGRIAVAQRPVPGARDHGALAHNDAADRHLASGLGGAGFGKRVIHERLCHKVPTMASNQNTQGERIAKVMARAGLCSRREAEGWITAGRVSVNGERITSPALNVSPADKIVVDGKPMPSAERTRLFLYHKPGGLVTTSSDPQGRPTIFEALPKDLPRLVSVGRLDLATEGLLLLTNDGGLARALELPSTAWLRRYRVRAYGKVTQAQLDELRGGVTVDGINYGAIEATLDREQPSNVWITFAIREGKNREVRNVLRHLGLQVSRLIRVSFGPFQLGDLPEGDVAEVPTRILRDQLGDKLAKAAGVNFAAAIVERGGRGEAKTLGGHGPRSQKTASDRGAPPPTRAKREGEEPRGGAKRDKPPVSNDKKKFQRPRHGEGARPSFDERSQSRSAPRGGRPARGSDKPRGRNR